MQDHCHHGPGGLTGWRLSVIAALGLAMAAAGMVQPAAGAGETAEVKSLLGSYLAGRVARLFPEAFGALGTYCAEHLDFEDPVITRLDRELAFCLAWLDLVARLEHYNESNAPGALGKHSYTLEEYGMSEADVATALAEYLERFAP